MSRAAFICSDDIQVGSFSRLVESPRFIGAFDATMVSLDDYYSGNFTKSWSSAGLRQPVRNLRSGAFEPVDMRRSGALAAWKLLFTEAIRDVKRAMDELRPEVLITSNDNGFLERLFIREARRRRVPSILLQEGVIAASSRTGFRDRLKMVITRCVFRPLGLEIMGTTRYGCGGCDFVAVYGDRFCDVLAALGVDRKRLRVVGSMRFDLLNDAPATFDRERFCEQNGIDPTRTIYTVLTTNILTALHDREAHNAQLREIGHIIEAVSNIDRNSCVVVKLHPRDEAVSYESIARENPDVRIIRDASLYHNVLASRVTFCSLSAAAYEAVALHRPCLITSIEFRKGTRIRSEIEEMPFDIISEPGELASVLKECRSQGGLDEVIRRQHRQLSDVILQSEQSSAVDRMIDLIEEACLGSHQHFRASIVSA